MFGKRPGWLGFVTLYAALLIVPILLYVFVYQESRIDQATMRNFRALEAAAKRIEEVLGTASRVALNSSLGVDQKLLEDIGNLDPSSKSDKDDSKIANLGKNVRKTVCPNEQDSCTLYPKVINVAKQLHKNVKLYRDRLDIKADLERLNQPSPKENSGGDTSIGGIECRNGDIFIKGII